MYIHTSSVYRTYTICPSPRNVGNSSRAVRRGTNFLRFVYTTNANGKIFGDFYVSFFDIFFISWSKRGDGFHIGFQKNGKSIFYGSSVRMGHKVYIFPILLTRSAVGSLASTGQDRNRNTGDSALEQPDKTRKLRERGKGPTRTA